MAEPREATPLDSIDVTLLGRFSVRATGTKAEIRLPHDSRQVLAYLLLHPERRESREELSRALFAHGPVDPGEALAEAVRGLQRAMREAVGSAIVRETEDGELELASEPGVNADVEAFDRGVAESRDPAALRHGPALERVLDVERLYQGHLLDDWTEGWLLAPRAIYFQRYLGVLDAVLAHFESAGDHPRVILYATRAVAVDPLRESAYRSLLASLDELGDHAGAMRQYERLEETLRRESGRSPEPATAAIAERIRSAIAKAAESPRRQSR
jgi:DNA-binding SARP family transcriptional activator